MSEESKLKHLEFIQDVITRMANNSFLIKGWSVTLVAALFAVESKSENPSLGFVAAIPVGMFWILDAFFLSREIRYRELFKFVAAKKNDGEIDFDMNAEGYENDKNAWIVCVMNPTLAIFHGGLSAVVLIAWCIILKMNICASS